jgi:hypothetical protein
MKGIVRSLLVTGLLFFGTSEVMADFIIGPHSGSTDPATEGFTFFTAAPAPTTGPLTPDGSTGFNAWQITTTGFTSQGSYASGAFTGSQLSDIANNGYVLSLRARPIKNSAQAWSPGTPIAMATADVGLNASTRFTIALSLNGSGDTVVTLASSVSSGGPGGSVLTPGTSFTLTGDSGSYHFYQLDYNGTTGLADLFIDGIDEHTAYAGHSSFASNFGLAFGADSFAEGNFNLVELTSSASVPEPASLTLLAVTTAGAAAFACRRRRTAIQPTLPA